MTDAAEPSDNGHRDEAPPEKGVAGLLDYYQIQDRGSETLPAIETLRIGSDPEKSLDWVFRTAHQERRMYVYEAIAMYKAARLHRCREGMCPRDDQNACKVRKINLMSLLMFLDIASAAEGGRARRDFVQVMTGIPRRIMGAIPGLMGRADGAVGEKEMAAR